ALPRARRRVVVRLDQRRELTNMTRRFIGLGLATLLTALAPACAHDALGAQREVELATHVEDWRDHVMYQLVVDRFANGDAHNDWRVDPTSLARYQGGDWQGVIDQMDYLQALGVTALWISPIILNVDTDAGIDGYHGYWAVD